MKNKKSFLIYKEWGSLFLGLPDDQAGQLIRAMCRRAAGEDAEIDDPLLRAVFEMIAGRMDEDLRKYEEVCRKRAEAIEKRWGKKDDTKEYKSIQDNTKVKTSSHMYTDNDNVNENDNDNDNDNVNENENENENDNVNENENDNVNENDNESLYMRDNKGGYRGEGKTSPTRPRFTPPTPAEVEEYIAGRGETIDADRFCDFYASKGWMVGKSKMKDWKAAARNWARENRARAQRPPERFDPLAYMLEGDT